MCRNMRQPAGRLSSVRLKSLSHQPLREHAGSFIHHIPSSPGKTRCRGWINRQWLSCSLWHISNLAKWINHVSPHVYCAVLLSQMHVWRSTEETGGRGSCILHQRSTISSLCMLCFLWVEKNNLPWRSASRLARGHARCTVAN